MRYPATLVVVTLLLTCCGSREPVRGVSDRSLVLGPVQPEMALPPESLARQGRTYPVEGGDQLAQVITPIEWPGWDVRLVDVNEAAGHAILWLQSERAVSIWSVDVAEQRPIEVWGSTPPELPHAGRFRVLGTSLEQDLARYAALFGPGDGSYLTPGVVLPPGDRHVMYGVDATNGRDGDCWQVADRATGRDLFRFAPTLTASYDLAFSPDGRRVAWSGCCHTTTRGGNPYHLYLGAIDGTPREVVSVPHPCRPLFDPDGEAVYVTSRHHPDRMCIHLVPFSEPSMRRELLCRPSADHLSHLFQPEEVPDRLVVVNPTTRSGDYEVLLVSTHGGQVLVDVDVPGSGLEPMIVDDLRVLLRAPPGLILVDLASGTSTVVYETEPERFFVYATVLRQAGREPSALIIRGTRGRTAGQELVRIAIP